MQLGFVTAIFPNWSLEQVLAFAQAERYDCIEVMCWPQGGSDRKYGGVTHLDLADFPQSAADDARGKCEKYGVKFSALGYYPNILSPNREEGEVAIAQLKRVIEAAPKLGLKNVNTFIGNDYTQPFDHNFARFREVWPGLIRFAEERGIYIGIENCPMLFSRDEWPGGKNLARSPEIWRQMFEAIPSDHFGLNYDPSHFVMQMMDPIAPITEFKHKLFHLHAKDMRIDRRRLDQRGVFSLPPGWCTPKIPGLGDVNWNSFFSALTDAGYGGPVCVEVEDDSYCHNDELRKQSLRVSRNVLRPLMGDAL